MAEPRDIEEPQPDEVMSHANACEMTAALEAAQESQRLTEAILATAADPVIVIDGAGIIVLANHATSELFGFTQEALIGNNVSILMPEPYHTEHDAYITNYIETGITKIIGVGREVSARRRDGDCLIPIDLNPFYNN